jgi:hypothetical protein
MWPPSSIGKVGGTSWLASVFSGLTGIIQANLNASFTELGAV